jgi:hypothetical protein
VTVCKRAIEHNRTEGGDGGRAAELAGNNGVRVCLVWEKSRGKGGEILWGAAGFVSLVLTREGIVRSVG